MTIHHRVPLFIVGVALFGLAARTDPAQAVNGRPAEAAVPLSVDLGASSRAPSRVAMDAAAAARHNSRAGLVRRVADSQADVAAVGVVNSIDPAQKRINLSHQSIPAIGWPAMTMDFPVAPTVDLSTVKPGGRVNVTLRKGKDGMYEIRSVQPAGR